MSTSDPHGSAPLTRKQLREAAQHVGAAAVEENVRIPATRRSSFAESSPPETVATTAPGSEQPTFSTPAPSEPAPSEPVPSSASADASSELPLTRREIRERERIRTASLSVLPEPQTPEESMASRGEEPVAPTELVTPRFDPAASHGTAAPAATASFALPSFGSTAPREEVRDAAPFGTSADELALTSTGSEPVAQGPVFAESDRRPVAPLPEADVGATEEDGTRAVAVTEEFGASLLRSEGAKEQRTRSFDDLLASDAAGSQHAAPNALIFQQSPGVPSLSGPVAATGEILVTGSYELPEGFGSHGHAKGTTDGKEVDAVLVDGELPPASSPTPIAASAAISTIKPAGEVIRPPEPEKTGKLMITLTITAGVLAIALVGAIIVAIMTGAFS